MCLTLFIILAALVSQGLGCGSDCTCSKMLKRRTTSFKPPNHDAFEQFKTQHNRNYDTAEEHDSRRAIFENNLELIEKHNEEEKLGLHSFKMSLNQFADLSKEEFMQHFTGGSLKNAVKPLRKMKKFTGPMIKGKRQGEAPESVNWVEQGFVSPVRTQECGDGWAFASAANIESNWAIKSQTKIGDKKYWISTQQLDDCVYPEGGCGGGNVGDAFKYVHDNEGILWEKDLPYNHGQIGSCPNDTALSKAKAEIGVSGDKHPENDQELQEALISSPVTVLCSICSDSIQQAQFYKEGIVEIGCDNNCSVSNGLLAVGYGKENGQAYWLIKNSWGPEWGEQGYVRLARNEKCVTPQQFPEVFNIDA